MAELNDRCFCYFTAAMLATWRLHTKLYKFGWNTFPNNARKNYRTDLNLGEVVYISIIFHIPVYWLDLLNGYVFFIFDGVTLKTSHNEQIIREKSLDRVGQTRRKWTKEKLVLWTIKWKHLWQPNIFLFCRYNAQWQLLLSSWPILSGSGFYVDFEVPLWSNSLYPKLLLFSTLYAKGRP